MNIFDKYTSDLELNESTTLQMIEEVEQQLRVKLPSDYVDFLLFSNGCEGGIGESYFVMWPIEELVQNNEDCEVEEYTPGLVLFGSNGAGEAFGFDMRTEEVKYIMIPFMLEYEAIIEQGRTIIDFFEQLYNGTLFDKK